MSHGQLTGRRTGRGRVKPTATPAGQLGGTRGRQGRETTLSCQVSSSMIGLRASAPPPPGVKIHFDRPPTTLLTGSPQCGQFPGLRSLVHAIRGR